jgi:cellulose synthase operon protein B
MEKPEFTMVRVSRIATYMFLVLWNAVCCWPLTAFAQPVPAGRTAAGTPSSANVTTEDLPFAGPFARPQGSIALSRLYSQPGPVRLKGDRASFNLSIPLAATVELQQASVELHYTNSIALLPGRSVMAIRLNDATLAQVHLDPSQPVGVVTVNLPVELWHPGYNNLTIDVTQHYTEQCEDPNAPELWTEIDLFHSRLHYKVAPRQTAYMLSDLGSILSPGLGGQSRVLLLTAAGPAADQLRSEALPYIAEALALRRRYAPLTIEAMSWTKGGQGNIPYLPGSAPADVLHVLVGTPGELAQVLPKNDQPAISGPSVFLDNVGGDRARLVVTGRTPDEVITAAHNLVVLQDHLTPDTQALFLPGQSPTQGMPLTGRSVLRPATTYTFNELGTSTATLAGAGIHRISVPLPLAADYYTQENAKADLSLNFAYSAAMGVGSAMNVFVNGEFIEGIFFDNAAGTRFTNYRLQVPVKLFRPGMNTLDFELTTHPYRVGAACTSQEADYIFAQIFGSSNIHLPDAGHAAMLPDLARFAAAGFPYVSNDGNAVGTIYIDAPALEGSALTLIGKLAQTVQGPVSGWRVAVGVPSKITGQAIVLATPDRLSSDYYGNLSAAIATTKRWPYRALEDLRTVSSQPHLTLGNLWSAFFGQTPQASPFPPQQSLTQRTTLGDLGVGVELRNPHGAASDTLLVITADTDARIGDRVQALVQPEVWSQLKGDLVAWRKPTTAVYTMAVAQQYEAGSKDRWLLLRLAVSNNPLPWIAAAAIAAALATAAAFVLLRRRKRDLDKGQA